MRDDDNDKDTGSSSSEHSVSESSRAEGLIDPEFHSDESYSENVSSSEEQSLDPKSRPSSPEHLVDKDASSEGEYSGESTSYNSEQSRSQNSFESGSYDSASRSYESRTSKSFSDENSYFSGSEAGSLGSRSYDSQASVSHSGAEESYESDGRDDHYCSDQDNTSRSPCFKNNLVQEIQDGSYTGSYSGDDQSYDFRKREEDEMISTYAEDFHDSRVRSVSDCDESSVSHSSSCTGSSPAEESYTSNRSEDDPVRKVYGLKTARADEDRFQSSKDSSFQSSFANSALSSTPSFAVDSDSETYAAKDPFQTRFHPKELRASVGGDNANKSSGPGFLAKGDVNDFQPAKRVSAVESKLPYQEDVPTNASGDCSSSGDTDSFADDIKVADSSGSNESSIGIEDLQENSETDEYESGSIYEESQPQQSNRHGPYTQRVEINRANTTCEKQRSCSECSSDGQSFASEGVTEEDNEDHAIYFGTALPQGIDQSLPGHEQKKLDNDFSRNSEISKTLSVSEASTIDDSHGKASLRSAHTLEVGFENSFGDSFASTFDNTDPFGDVFGSGSFHPDESFGGSLLSKDEPLGKITEHSVEQSSPDYSGTSEVIGSPYSQKFDSRVHHDGERSLLGGGSSVEDSTGIENSVKREGSRRNLGKRTSANALNIVSPSSPLEDIPQIFPVTVSGAEEENETIALASKQYNRYSREQMSKLANAPPCPYEGDEFNRSPRSPNEKSKKKRRRREKFKSTELLDLVANVNDAIVRLEVGHKLGDQASSTDIDLESTPRLLIYGFEALVGIFLQLADELELISTFARKKDAAAISALQVVLSFAPTLDDVFAELKPILQHFLEEEHDEEMNDFLYGMNFIVDLLCELTYRVGEKQEWNARSNTSFSTLIELLARDLLEVVSIFGDVDTPDFEVSAQLQDAWETTGHEEEFKTLEVTNDLDMFRQICYEVMISTDQWCPDTTTLMHICGIDQGILDEQSLQPSPDDRLAPTPEQAIHVLEKITGDPLPRLSTFASVMRRIMPIQAISDPKLTDRFASVRSNVRNPLGLSSSSNLVAISSVPEILYDPNALGVAGVGKTTLAAMVADHEDVRRFFHDGIAWLHIGQKELNYTRYVQCLRDLVAQLGVDEHDEPLFPELLNTPGESKAKRRRREEGFMIFVRETMLEFLRYRNVLIVLDNVCFEPDLDWFDFGPSPVEGDQENEEEFACVVLITSRCRNLLPAADTIEVDMLDEAESITLLIQESGKLPHSLMAGSPETRAVVLECANHPLAVKSVGRWLNLKHATAGAVSSVEEIHEDVVKSMENVLKTGGQEDADMMYEILNMSLTPSMNGEPTVIIKFCFSAFVLVFCDQKLLSDFALADSSPIIPIEIAKLLFESILELEEECLLKEGSLFCGQKNEATDLIPEALKALGIFKEISTFSESVENGSQNEETEEKYLQIMHIIQQEYGEYLLSEDLSLQDITRDAERRWNRALGEAYMAQNIYWDRDAPGAGLDYALELMPSHLIRGQLLTEAADLLSNESFVRGRLFAVGRENGTRRHIMDCEALFAAMVEHRTIGRNKLDPKATIKKAYHALGRQLTMDEDDYISEENSPEAVEVGRAHFEIGFSLAEKRCWDTAIEHWEKSQELIVSALGMVELVAGILYNIGVVYTETHEYEQALGSLKQCLKIRGAIHGEEHILYAQTIQRIGDIFLGMSDYHEAMESYNWALDVMHIEPSHHRIDIGDILENMGNIHFCKGELDEAVQCYQNALRSKQLDLGENHPELSTLYHHTGNCLSDQGKNDEAVALFEEAIRLKEFDPDGESGRDAEVLTIKGVLFILSGKQQEGLECYEKALQVLVTKASHKKEEVASLLHLIGCVYLLNGEQTKAMKLFKESLQARRKVLGFVHLDVAATLFNMAFVHQTRNRPEKALKCLEEALKIRQLRLPDGEKVAVTHERIGALARSIGKSKKAEIAFTEALRIRKVIHGDSHEAIASVLQELGDLMHDLEEYEDAMKYYTEALDIRHERLGPTDLAVAETLYSMGFTLQANDASDRALAFFDESLQIRTKHLGEDSNEVGDTLNMMGFLQVKRGELDEALGLLWEALQIRKLQKDSIKVSETLKNIGNVHREKEEHDLAIECYEECLRIRRAELGDEHEKVADALIAIGNVYSDIDEKEEAKECYKEGWFQ